MAARSTAACRGLGRLTVHHVRRYGEPKNDRRTIPLPASLHMKTHAKKGTPCIEDGKAVFERFHGVDIEASIVRYNDLYAKEIYAGETVGR